MFLEPCPVLADAAITVPRLEKQMEISLGHEAFKALPSCTSTSANVSSNLDHCGASSFADSPSLGLGLGDRLQQRLFLYFLPVVELPVCRT